MELERKKILYVDDDPESCAILRSWIRGEEGTFDLTTVSTIEEALESITKRDYDLFLFDYCLTTGTGAELCREIRGLNCSTPVLMYSAMGRQVDRDTARRAGANEYLVKPDDFDLLVPTMRRMLGFRSYSPRERPRRRTGRGIL